MPIFKGIVLLLFASCNVCGVKQVMRLVASGFAEIFFVNFLNNRVVVRFTVYAGFVFGIKGFCAKSFKINVRSGVCALQGLSAAVYASAGTSHYFDKVVISLAFFYLGKEFARICGSAYYSYLYFGACNVVSCFLYAFDTADLVIIDDPLYLFDAEEYLMDEIGYMGMVFVDRGPSFIRYKYGAQRVAFMYLDSLHRKYTVESETYSLPELLGSNKSFFIDEFMLTRRNLRLKSAVDPKNLRHAVTAIYRDEDPRILKIVRAVKARNIA